MLNRSPGFSFSFGVFQDYYSTHEPFIGATNIASVSTTATVSYLLINKLYFLT